jgi:hypothetical protein
MTNRLTSDFENRRTRFAADRAAAEARLRVSWAEIAHDALALTERLIATDGVESVEPLYVVAKLKVVLEGGTAGFPVQGASAGKTAMAFAQSLRALLDASLPRYRAIMAPFVAAGARAVAELITEHQTRQADAWRKQTGEEA